MSDECLLLPENQAELDMLRAGCRQDVVNELRAVNHQYTQEEYKRALSIRLDLVTTDFTNKLNAKKKAAFAVIFREFVWFLSENARLHDDMNDMQGGMSEAREMFCLHDFVDEIMDEFDEHHGQLQEQHIMKQYLTGDRTRAEIVAMMHTMLNIYQRALYVMAFWSEHDDIKVFVKYSSKEICQLRPSFEARGECEIDDMMIPYSHATNYRRTQYISQHPDYEKRDPTEFRVAMHQFLSQYPAFLQRNRDSEKQIAFAMACHRRLGSEAYTTLLEDHLIDMIAKLVTDSLSTPMVDTIFTRNMPFILPLPSTTPQPSPGHTPPHTPQFTDND